MDATEDGRQFFKVLTDNSPQILLFAVAPQNIGERFDRLFRSIVPRFYAGKAPATSL